MNFNLQYEEKKLFFVLPLGRNNVFACKKESLSFFCLYSIPQMYVDYTDTFHNCASWKD